MTVDVKDGLHHFIVITGDGENNSLHIRQYELNSNALEAIKADTDFVRKIVYIWDYNDI